MSVKLNHLLGLNARYFLYTSKYNKRGAKRIADSKLLTKEVLAKHKIPTPVLYNVFTKDSDVDDFDFSKLPSTFVLKPNQGLGGEGIIVVEKGSKYAGEWLTAQGEVVGVRDLELHIGDILEGRFSMNDLPDIALLEERVRIHPVFDKFAYHGTPDIRVIVFNSVPVMAMLRIPTKESGGRANLFQGAVGAGLDLSTGKTTNAISHGQYILSMPDTGKRIRGLQIPEWDKVLELAIRCQQASGVGLLGADIVLQPGLKHPGKTYPKVLELNAQPGLKIQLCNRAGMKRRIERVEGLEVRNPEHGIKIAKNLFGKQDKKNKKARDVKVFETVRVLDSEGRRVSVAAKVDTGAYRTSIDIGLAKELGIYGKNKVVEKKRYRSALGRGIERELIKLTFYLSGKKVNTIASVTDRSHMNKPFLVGRRDLKGFVIEF